MCDKSNDLKLREKWVREDEEFRVIRRRMADWDYIMKQPPRVRLALMVYIETGDIYIGLPG